MKNHPHATGLIAAEKAAMEAGWTPIEQGEDLRPLCDQLPAPLPLSLIPLGYDGENIICVDVSTSAMEREIVPLYVSTNTPFWELRSVFSAAGDSVEDASQPITFHHASKAAMASREDQADKTEAHLLIRALMSPLFTARDHQEITEVQERAQQLAEQGGFDAFGLRLADAELDGHAWRIIGAERAIANRIRFAIHAFHSAHFLHIPLGTLSPALQRLHGRAAWPWANDLLALHQDLCLEDV